jgi:hypothetical protein
MLGDVTVTVRQSGRRDADGNPIPPGAAFTVDNCLVAPVKAAELLAVDRSEGTTTVVVDLPITTGIDHTCELGIRGRWYRILGDPEPYISDEDPEMSGYQVIATRGSG